MDDTFSSVDNLSSLAPSDTVHSTSRSNKDKKRNGFSDALKEKMKEKLDKKKHTEDELILDEETKKQNQQAQPDSSEKEDDKQKKKNPEDSEKDSLLDHVDIKA